MEQTNNYIKQQQSDGTSNPTYVDLLEEDKPLSGQKFACISFVSPEKILKQKKHFYFEEFLKDFDLTKSTEKFTQFLNFISYKYSVKFEDLTNDLNEFLKTEADEIDSTYVSNAFKNFVDSNEERLDAEFGDAHHYQTNTRGIKIRGVFTTQGEAELRCKLLREVDPNHDVYVGPVGMWMPWEPEAYKTGRVEYLEEQLNQLMSEKIKNEEYAKIEFEKRVRDAKEKAIKDNIKLAKESGNKLTQNIDEHGNLVGVNSTIEQTLGLKGEITTADIQKELFEGDNIVIPKRETGQRKFNAEGKRE
tara:strand:- start:3913 stop:4824 length:912 start_codon:yes stop_codon:yes gene_type:complete